MTGENIKDILVKAGYTLNMTGENFWQITTPEGEAMVAFKPSKKILEFIIPFMKLPEVRREEFYKNLLDLNADGLDIGSFAVKDEEIMLVDRILTEDLDQSEVTGTVKLLFQELKEIYPKLVVWK